MSSTAWLGGYQIAIIDEAELLSEEASNALLKLLEEPSGQVVFFLITTNDQKLLPTIRSRTQLLYFSPVLSDEILQALIILGADQQTAQKIAELSWGRPGKALEMLENQEFFVLYQQEIERWQQLCMQPFYEQAKQVEILCSKGEKEDHIRNREELEHILELWVMLWRIVLFSKYRHDTTVVIKESIITKHPPEKLVKIIDTIQWARKLLRQNIHPRLLLEQVVMEF
jgi:DNA polymerase-3 subunit delta'